MLIHYMHSYCGGRLITGLHNPGGKSLEPGYCYLTSTKGWVSPANGNNEKADPCPNLPADYVEFLQLLRKFCYAAKGSEQFQGVLYAITNSAQTKAANQYLPDTGFKDVGHFRKAVYANDCISWIADYRKDVYPILSKVKDFSEVKNESKFGQPVRVEAAVGSVAVPTGYSLRDGYAQPAVSSVQDQVRNRAVETFSASTRR